VLETIFRTADEQIQSQLESRDMQSSTDYEAKILANILDNIRSSN